MHQMNEKPAQPQRDCDKIHSSMPEADANSWDEEAAAAAVQTGAKGKGVARRDRMGRARFEAIALSEADTAVESWSSCLEEAPAPTGGESETESCVRLVWCRDWNVAVEEPGKAAFVCVVSRREADGPSEL